MILHARRFATVRYSDDLPSPVMLALLPRSEVMDGELSPHVDIRPWHAPDL